MIDPCTCAHASAEHVIGTWDEECKLCNCRKFRSKVHADWLSSYVRVK